MRTLRDFQGMPVLLTDERLAHILEHPEMAEMEEKIEETLSYPGRVIESASDRQARLYYRFYLSTKVGGKYLCVVVKAGEKPFVLTAYLTDRVKRGVEIWPGKE